MDKNDMKTHLKPLVALGSGTLLFSGLLCQTAQAQQVIGQSASALAPGGSISGVTTLADTQGVNYGSDEILTVDWSVLEPSAGSYVYQYTLFNPAGDLILSGPNAGQSEIVDQFSVGFNDTAPGAYVPLSQTGGTLPNIVSGPEGGGGVNWVLGTPEVAAGANSGLLSFDSSLAPSDGNAQASDSTAPSPWSSSPEGGYLPVPGNGTFSVPVGGYFAPHQSNGVPDEANTMTLLAGVMLLLPFRSAIKKAVLK
jgi:hypothetical protein